MKRVLIATPAYDGRIVAWYVTALCNAINMSAEHGIKFDPIFNCYDSLIQRARNGLLRHAVENNYDGLLWIDSDIVWDPETAIKLVNSGHDAVGLPCVLKSTTEESYNIGVSSKNFQLQDGYLEVDFVGTGFLYLSKKALGHLWDNATIFLDGDTERRWLISPTVIKNGVLTGEDVDMCERLRDGGFKIFIDPSKTCGHIGFSTYTGDFNKFLKQVNDIKLIKPTY